MVSLRRLGRREARTRAPSALDLPCSRCATTGTPIGGRGRSEHMGHRPRLLYVHRLAVALEARAHVDAVRVLLMTRARDIQAVIGGGAALRQRAYRGRAHPSRAVELLPWPTRARLNVLRLLRGRAHLMREAINGHQRQSGSLAPRTSAPDEGGHQWSSVVIKGNQARLLRGRAHLHPAVGTARLMREAISGHQRSSDERTSIQPLGRHG